MDALERLALDFQIDLIPNTASVARSLFQLELWPTIFQLPNGLRNEVKLKPYNKYIN